MLSQSNDMRSQLINDGEKRDETILSQQKHAPESKPTHVIQHDFLKC